ncbi:Cation channel sperm-associated protein 4 [Phlyctochytrium planicorne]|nr:Cation channel sperm-associated protein 4 [Phlyctochytrium planicorne]
MSKARGTKDGITRAERRVLGKAGVDVMLTYGSFKLPGVQERGGPSAFPNRRVYFSRRVNTGGLNVSFAANPNPAKFEDNQVFLPRDDDDDDNTYMPLYYFSAYICSDSYNKVRKIIFGQAIKYNVTKLEQKYVNFTDIVDINDYEALENHVSEDLAARFGEGDLFRGVIMLVIVLNSIMIAIETDSITATKAADIFYILDYIFSTIFIIEILFKWYYGFVQFWKDGWNIFDLFLVTSTLAGSDTRVLRIIRVLRAFRALRSITVLNGLQTVIRTIMDSIPDMANIMILLLILMFIWAVVGVTLFQSVSPHYFGDLQSAMFTLFIMMTQIGWLEVFDHLEADGQFVAAAIYFSSFMVIGVFIFMKIIVAVVVSNLEETYANQRKQQKQKFRALKTSTSSTQGQKKYQRPIRSMPNGDDAVWKNQIPYEIPDFEKVSKAKVENYFLILSIIEENLREYSKLKEQISEIQFELKLINTSIVIEDEDENEEIHEDDEGDALSRWLARNKNV